MFQYSEFKEFLDEKKSTKTTNSKKTVIKSFSGFQQNQVLNAWKKACAMSDYETCCRWAIEMILSKWNELLWENVVLFCAKNIHSHNPKIGLFLLKFKADYPQFLSDKTLSTDPTIRQAIAFLMGVISYSPKGVVYPIPCIHITDDIIENAFSKLNSTALSQKIKSVTIVGDSHILCALIQACMNHASNNDLNNSFRILGWLLFIEKSKKYKNNITAGKRKWKGIDEKDYTDWLFLFWDICILYIPESGANIKLDSVIKAWRAFFIDKYKKSNRTSRLSIVVNVLILLSQKNFVNSPCINNEHIIQKACNNIDKMYNSIIDRRRIV